MKTKLLLFTLLVSLSSYAQYTFIPDVNFENKLITLGIDTGKIDGKVLTSKINTLTSLDVSGSNIADLTGIQDFVALQNLRCSINQLTNLDISNNLALKNLDCYYSQLNTLDVSKNLDLNRLDCGSNQLTTLDISKNLSLTYVSCYNNQLTSLNISKNLALTSLECSINQLTTLDVSKNLALNSLHCGSKQLTTLDISKNLALTSLSINNTLLTTLDVSKNLDLNRLDCRSNQLTTLDISKNLALTSLHCDSNQLTTLDISKNVALKSLGCAINKLIDLDLKNGNNSILSNGKDSDFTKNPNLRCIQVDDVAYSNSNWTMLKDATASYSASCPSLGIAETIFGKIAVYPNPVKGQLHINNIVLEKVTVYDATGKLIKTATFDKGSANNTINLAALPSGFYYIYLQSEGDTKVEKIIVE